MSIRDPSADHGHVETSPKRIRVVFADLTIADSTEARLVWENPNWGEYYFPRDAIAADVLVATDHTSTHPLLGDAAYYTVRVGDREAPNAAWGYPDSPVAEIRELIRFDWAAMDRWYEESEEVFVDPRNPYARIDVLESDRRVQVSIDGVEVADSRRAKFLFETRVPTRYYLPHDDVRVELLTPTDKSTRCPYKGFASFWTARIGDVDHTDIVWSYLAPLPEAVKVSGHLCFYNEKVDIRVDGVAQCRPVPPVIEGRIPRR
jgi:uncharacterized protein (DUF427 family)